MASIYVERLIKRVIELSQSSDWDTAVAEWEIADCEEDDILTDISNLCSVLFEAVHNISNVFDIQFHKPTADNFCRTFLCTNANQWSLRANCFNDQLQNVIQHFGIVRVILLQQINTELIREIIKVFLIPVILVHHSTIPEGKIESVSLNSVFLISVLLPCDFGSS